MRKIIMVSRIKPLLRGRRWRAGVMLVWLMLFVMGCNDFYIRNAAVDGLCFIGVFLFCILFPDRRRGQVYMSDPYRRSDDAPSFLRRYPYRLTGSNHGGEFPPSASDSWSTLCGSTSFGTSSYDYSSSSGSNWTSSYDSGSSWSSSSLSSTSYDTSRYNNGF